KTNPFAVQQLVGLFYLHPVQQLVAVNFPLLDFRSVQQAVGLNNYQHKTGRTFAYKKDSNGKTLLYQQIPPADLFLVVPHSYFYLQTNPDFLQSFYRFSSTVESKKYSPQAQLWHARNECVALIVKAIRGI